MKYMTDILIIFGVITIGTGLGLLDWRWLIIWIGLVLLAAGLARLRLER